MAVQNQGASACNFRAKCLHAAVEHQAVTTTRTLDSSSQILHAGVCETMPQVSNRTPDCLGRLHASVPDIMEQLIRRDVLIWMARKALSQTEEDGPP